MGGDRRECLRISLAGGLAEGRRAYERFGGREEVDSKTHLDELGMRCCNAGWMMTSSIRRHEAVF